MKSLIKLVLIGLLVTLASRYTHAEDLTLILWNNITGTKQTMMFKDKNNCNYIGELDDKLPIHISKKNCLSKVEDVSFDVDLKTLYSFDQQGISAGSIFVEVEDKKDQPEDSAPSVGFENVNLNH